MRYVLYWMSCIIFSLTNIESVISWYFLSQFLKQSKNYINSNFRFWSTSTSKDTKFLLPQHIKIKHQNTKQYQGSYYRGELDLNSDVNQPDSGKLCQSTTIYSQCEKFSWLWTRSFMYFDHWSHFKKRPGIV